MDATEEDMRRNVNLAIMFGQSLRRKFPGIYFYVPGDHEFPPVANLLRRKYITTKQILAVDCEIVQGCSFVIAYSPDGYLSSGMNVEIEDAGENGIPVIMVSGLNKSGVIAINRQIKSFMR